MSQTFQGALRVLEAKCGGERGLASLLHVKPRSVADYRIGRMRPSLATCRYLARICATLYGPGDERSSATWWRQAP